MRKSSLRVGPRSLLLSVLPGLLTVLVSALSYPCRGRKQP